MESKDLETNLLDKNVEDEDEDEDDKYGTYFALSVTVFCYFFGLFKITNKIKLNIQHIKHTNVYDLKYLVKEWLLYCIVTTYIIYHRTKKYHNNFSKVCMVFLAHFLAVLPLLLNWSML